MQRAPYTCPRCGQEEGIVTRTTCRVCGCMYNEAKWKGEHFWPPVFEFVKGPAGMTLEGLSSDPVKVPDELGILRKLRRVGYHVDLYSFGTGWAATCKTRTAPGRTRQEARAERGAALFGRARSIGGALRDLFACVHIFGVFGKAGEIFGHIPFMYETESVIISCDPEHDDIPF